MKDEGMPGIVDPSSSFIPSPSSLDSEFRFARQALHAYEITFVHPITLKSTTLQAPLPKDIQELLAVMRREVVAAPAAERPSA